MTVAPAAPATLAPVDILVSVPRRHEVRSFCDAVRMAVRFVPLPPSDRALVLADVAALEEEAAADSLRPHVVAALRWKIESVVETYAGGSAPAAQAG